MVHVQPSAMEERLSLRVAQAGGVRAFARAHGFDASYISDVMNGRRPIAERLAGCLGYRRVTFWIEEGNEDGN